jgi:hypothetical protein
MAECACEADGEVQKPLHFDRPLNESMERLTTGILEHKSRSLIAVRQYARTNCPGWVEFIFQCIFVVYLL